VNVWGLIGTAVAVSLAVGCGSQGGAGTTRDRSGITGQVQLGPQCPVESADHPCPDRPAAGSTVTIAEQHPADSGGGDVVARTTTDRDGRFRVALAPGRYVVTADAGMSCGLIDVRVPTGAYSKVELPCDTGIR
jgi:Carboxypeptidase regulatory-like domain